MKRILNFLIAGILIASLMVSCSDKTVDLLVEEFPENIKAEADSFRLANAEMLTAMVG